MKLFLICLFISGIYRFQACKSSEHMPKCSIIDSSENCINQYFGSDTTDLSEWDKELKLLFEKGAVISGGCPRFILLQYLVSGYKTQRKWYSFIEGNDSTTFYFVDDDFGCPCSEITKLDISFSSLLRKLESFSKEKLNNQTPVNMYKDGYTLLYYDRNEKLSTWFWLTDEQEEDFNKMLTTK